MAQTLFGQDHVLTDRPLSLSGDNFAENPLHVPGAYAYLGSGTPALPNTMRPGHNGNCKIDEEVLVLGGKLCADYAVSILHAAAT